MYPTKESIICRIRPLAEEKGVSLKELCRVCGLGVNALYQSDNLTAKSLYAIAEYLDCSIDYILGRREHMNGVETELLLDRINSGMPLRMLVEIYGADFVEHYTEYRQFAEQMKEEEGAVFY